ncbi:MAG TPA: branched-chain amino acid ABC transporter permease [Armatimonadota bacterium]|nr:branched-chain amino acid ABC transporter permease [Armatimonadota bacterium]
MKIGDFAAAAKCISGVRRDNAWLPAFSVGYSNHTKTRNDPSLNLPQSAANTLIVAGVVLLVGTGFSLIYRTVRFFHFAHGGMVAVGPYLVLGFVLSGVPRLIAIATAVLLCATLGVAMEILLYRPLRRNSASSLVLLLASLGIYVLLQNTISLIFGDDTKSIRIGPVVEGINVLGARITPIQIATICVSIVLVIALAVFLRYSRLGRAMRAVANDRELAGLSGIDSDQVILCAFAIGSALAGVAGILVALDVDMTPTMGMNALMMGIVAVIIGGANSIPGIALGALLLGMAQQFGVWKISSQWQDAIAFFILLAFLLFRPQGFLGRVSKMHAV